MSACYKRDYLRKHATIYNELHSIDTSPKGCPNNHAFDATNAASKTGTNARKRAMHIYVSTARGFNLSSNTGDNTPGSSIYIVRLVEDDGAISTILCRWKKSVKR